MNKPPKKIKICNTFSKTLQNVETMFWVKSEVYTSPTFFTIESMRYNTGSLISARTYMNRTNIFGGMLQNEALLLFSSKTAAMSSQYHIQDGRLQQNFWLEDNNTSTMDANGSVSKCTQWRRDCDNIIYVTLHPMPSVLIHILSNINLPHLAILLHTRSVGIWLIVLELLRKVQGGAEKRENLKLTMRFRPRSSSFCTWVRNFEETGSALKKKKSLVGMYCLYVSQKTLMLW
jgi:hypothetical protein